MTDNERKLTASLRKDIRKLQMSVIGYLYSYENCTSIGIQQKRTPEEEVEFEAFTSRYARMVDLLTQRLLKGLFILLKEDLPTFIDRANAAEKLGLIRQAGTLRVIRELRNRIAHEYAEEDIDQLYLLLFEVHDELISLIRLSVSYTETLLKKLGLEEE